MTKEEQLKKLREEEVSDHSLPLKDTATNLVFGDGSANAKVIFLGEAPGRFEDLKGLPFIGAAGKILDLLLESINLKREDVFITSVLHYRPPNNRQPKPEEIKAFAKYLDQIIEIINPKVIATLGNFSLNKFLPEAKISKVHGVPQEIKWDNKSLTLLPLYHPAAAIYQRTLLETLKEDFQVIKKVLTSN